jgi:hypothetical protein
MLLIVLQLIHDADNPYDIVADLLRALPSGSYVVLSHPASDIRTAQMAEMTSRVNERISGPEGDHAGPGRGHALLRRAGTARAGRRAASAMAA